MFKRLITLGAKFIKMVKPAVNEAKEKLPEVAKKTEKKVGTYEAPKVAEVGKATSMKRPDGCTVETTTYTDSPVRRRQTVYDKNGNIISESATYVKKSNGKIISENATYVKNSNEYIQSTFERRDYTTPLAVGENKGAQTNHVLIDRAYSPTSNSVTVYTKVNSDLKPERIIQFQPSGKLPVVTKKDVGHTFHYLPLSY